MANIKPKIVMVVDQPNWAFAISARDMVEHMSDKYDMKIISWYDSPNDPRHYEGVDLVYLFGHYMENWMPEGFDFSKSCTGVRALFGYVDDLEDHRQNPWIADNAKHILKFPSIHVVSKELYDIFLDFHPNVHHICHGVDTKFYTQKSSYEPRRPLILGWAGNRSNKVKGIEFLEGVLGPRTDTVLKTAEFGEKQLNREQLRDFYQSVDVFVLPSVSEGVSAAMLEAMACGLPIMSTDTGGWTELKNLGGGITIERTHKSINEALDAFHKMSAEDLKKMGDINRREMVEKWDWSIKAKEFDRFFQSALKQKRADDKTIRTFQDKWEMMPKGYGFKDAKQVKFFMDWAVRKYGLKDIEDLNRFYASKKNILELGFGSAFNMRYISEHSDAQITGVDTSPTACENARELFKDNNKIQILNMDLRDAKDIPGEFDLIIADGVLHHTEKTKESIKILYNKLMRGGQMYVYLYRKMGKIREFTNDYIRFKMRGLSSTECARACESITKLGRELSAIKDKVKIDAIPILGLPAGEYTPHEIFYYGVMKCFWNDVFSFEENNLNNFDWFGPQFAHRFDQQDVEGWMKEIGCSYKINNSNLNGISVLIKKP